jgi:hypothetical protein
MVEKSEEAYLCTDAHIAQTGPTMALEFLRLANRPDLRSGKLDVNILHEFGILSRCLV